MKQIYSILLLIFLCGFASAQSKTDLKFNESGEFKILQFTDTHINMEVGKNLEVFQIVETILKAEKPDFVIFTGDVTTQPDPQRTYDRFFTIFEKYKTPWAVVFGNHESERNISRKVLADYLNHLPYCLNNDKGEITGNSNFVLEVKGKGNKTDALLYCLDSNSYSTLKPKIEGYGWFAFDQIKWYREKSQHYTKLNGGMPIPAIALFHIPIPEYINAWENKLNPPIGARYEDEGSPEINTGMFAAMLECGDVMGTFVGHDHINDYIGVHHGIALAYGRTSNVKNNPEIHQIAGGRVIVLKEGERKFDTWIRDMNGNIVLECKFPDSFNQKP